MIVLIHVKEAIMAVRLSPILIIRFQIIVFPAVLVLGTFPVTILLPGHGPLKEEPLRLQRNEIQRLPIIVVEFSM